MGSQLDPLPLSRVGSRERLPSPNFPQLYFGELSRGFTLGLGSASISFRRYVHTSTAQACPFKNHESDRSWSSCSSSTSSILLQLELSYLSDAAEDQKHSKSSQLQSSSLLSFLLSFSQNSFLPPKLPLSPLSDLYPFSICSLSTLPSSFFPPTVF